MNLIKTLHTQRNDLLLDYSYVRNSTSFSRGFGFAKWNTFAIEKMKQILIEALRTSR